MLRNAILLTSGSLAGKILGIVREVLLASFFGTSSVADAYRAVLTLISAPMHMFATEPLNATFIPRFSRDIREAPESAWNFFTAVSTTLLAGSVLVSLLLYYFAENVIEMLLPGFLPSTSELAITMLRILAIGFPFCVVSFLFISLGAARKKYLYTAARPFFFNIGVIIAILSAYYLAKPAWLAWGFSGTCIVFAVAVFVTMLMNGTLIKSWYRYCSRLVMNILQFLRLLKPLVLFSLMLQINLLLEKTIASLIAPGAVAAMDYAKLIPETASLLLMAPLGLLSLSEMPGYSKEEMQRKTDIMSAYTLLLLVPVSAFVGVNSEGIISVIYARGAFDLEAQYTTGRALLGMSFGLWAYCLTYILMRIYNAQFRNHDVLKYSGIAILTNALFNIIAYKGLGVLALGIGFSLYGIISALLFLRGLSGMSTSRRIAQICFIAVVPYIGVAVSISLLEMTMWAALFIQVLWALVFWGCVLFLFSESRRLLHELAQKVLSLR